VVRTSLGTAQAPIDQTLPGAAQAFEVRLVQVQLWQDKRQVKGDKIKFELWPFLKAVGGST
jgi:hypothetical protein